jgi:hypothetical protein
MMATILYCAQSSLEKIFDSFSYLGSYLQIQSIKMVLQLKVVLDFVVVGFTNTCAISAYHHLSCVFEPCSCQGVLNATFLIKF